MTSWTTDRARLAAIIRHRPHDFVAIAEARQRLEKSRAAFLAEAPSRAEREREERFRRRREAIAARLAVELPAFTTDEIEHMARLASELVCDEW